MEKKGIVNVIFLLSIVLAMTFSLCSCSKSENVLLSEFKAITKEDPTYTSLESAVSFMNVHSEKLSEEGASRLILAYEDFLLRFLEKNETIGQASGSELFIYTDNIDGISVNRVDYESLISKYGGYVGAELLELLSIKASETKEPAVKDSALQISYEALLERTLRVEDLLAAHSSEDFLKASATEYYKNYVTLLLSGNDYSPLFNYETGEFSPLARDAYENFIVEHPETITAGILTEYSAYLNSIKYTMDYMDATENKVFYDTCDYLIEKAGQSF